MVLEGQKPRENTKWIFLRTFIMNPTLTPISEFYFEESDFIRLFQKNYLKVVKYDF